MEEITTVFWDLDGTIAETEMDGHRVAFNMAFSHIGLDWHWDRIIYSKLLLVAGGKNRIRKYLEDTNYSLKEHEIVKIHLLKQQFYVEVIKKDPPKLRIGVERILREIECKKIKQYIVTTSSQTAITAFLNAAFPQQNIPFSGWISGDDVIKHKPNPEAYIKAIELFSCVPEEILVIEDSPAGYFATQSANLKCLITLPEWWQGNVDVFERAVAIVTNLGDDDVKTEVVKGNVCKQGKITFEYFLDL
ncbi:HAD-IA family hydrolase [Prochlorococcus sp. MIT 1341]|uniref:HAD-IA family hydrolase n=1 Tax=Prochlorococcus sp. MIT 1341 TaxID=3096221 RepID=UPI002A74A5F8|nr:HAD-IA family hydrolase [Prochlorococcus sp. MIT 1341]